jgi:putative sterol carrier protein
MPPFPTEQWLQEYRRRLNDSDAFAELGEGWGRGFDGDVLYVITDLPTEETTLGELPEATLSGLPDHVRERVADVTVADAPETFEPIRSSIPDDLADKLDQLESHVVDDTVYAYLGLEDGRCTEAEVVDGPDARETGFVMRGTYEVWRDIVDGRPSSSAVLSRDLTVSGNRLRRLRYAPMFQLLGSVASEVETTHLFEGGDSTATPLLDTAMRGRMVAERETHRSVKRTLNLL